VIWHCLRVEPRRRSRLPAAPLRSGVRVPIREACSPTDSAGGELASKTEPGVDGDETPARALAGPPIVGATGSVESVHPDPNAIGEDGAWSSGGRSYRRRRRLQVQRFE
jgi:hypothetical protein